MRVLSPDQRWAVVDIATSGRPVDVLVGPAGTGKTLTLATLRRAWERRFGHGSVAPKGFAGGAAIAVDAPLPALPRSVTTTSAKEQIAVDRTRKKGHLLALRP